MNVFTSFNGPRKCAFRSNYFFRPSPLGFFPLLLRMGRGTCRMASFRQMVSLRKCSGLSCVFEPWLTTRQLIKLVLRESEPGLDGGYHRDPMEEPVARVPATRSVTLPWGIQACQWPPLPESWWVSRRRAVPRWHRPRWPSMFSLALCSSAHG